MNNKILVVKKMMRYCKKERILKHKNNKDKIDIIILSDGESSRRKNI